MTRQAERLTVQFQGEEGVWLARGLELGLTAPQLVSPTSFANWASHEWIERHGGRLARLLRSTSHPMSISTALHQAAVRLEVRANRLHRQWVAFSGMERWLRDVKLPGANFADDIAEYCIGYRFDRADPPLAGVHLLNLVRCAGHDVHWYPVREPEARDLRSVALAPMSPGPTLEPRPHG